MRVKRIIFLVSRNHPELVEWLREVSASKNVEVIVDRRRGPRRRKFLRIFSDRRGSDRRTRRKPQQDLIGLDVVVVP